MTNKHIYKIIFLNHGKVYELFCRSVSSSGLWGFIEVAELVFNEDDNIVVDPVEEKMRSEFQGVNVLHLPMQSVLRVEEVASRGKCRIRDQESGENVTPFPMSPGGRT